MIDKTFKHRGHLLFTAVSLLIIVLFIALPRQAAADNQLVRLNEIMSFTFATEADEAVLSNRPTSNLGLSQQLSTDATPEMYSLLRFNVTGLSGSECSYALLWDGASNGLSGANIDGLSIQP